MLAFKCHGKLLRLPGLIPICDFFAEYFAGGSYHLSFLFHETVKLLTLSVLAMQTSASVGIPTVR